jgi:hypothetical protein
VGEGGRKICTVLFEVLLTWGDELESCDFVSAKQGELAFGVRWRMEECTPWPRSGR